MAEKSSLARPYAKAVFELARDEGDYASWSDQLAFLAELTANETVLDVISNPEVSEQQLADLIIEIGGDQLSDEGRNLVRLLAHNGRLTVSAEIDEQFQVLRDEAEQVIEAQLITATEVDEVQVQKIQAALAERLGKQVKLESKVDEGLIGGAIVRAGDWVVDGSVHAQLRELVSAIGS